MEIKVMRCGNQWQAYRCAAYAYGDTRAEAIGNLLLNNQNYLDISIKEETEMSKADKSYFQILDNGLDIQDDIAANQAQAYQDAIDAMYDDR